MYKRCISIQRIYKDLFITNTKYEYNIHKIYMIHI